MHSRDENEIDVRAIAVVVAVLALYAAIPASVRNSQTAHPLLSLDGLRANLVVLLPLVTALIMTALWYLLERGVGAGSVPARYAPPNGLSPMEAGVLIDGSLDPRDVVGGVVDLAIRGYLRIGPLERDPNGGFAADYRFENLHCQGWATELPAHDRFLMQHIFEAGTEPLLSSLRHGLHDYLPQFRDSVLESLLRKKIYRLHPDLGRTLILIGGGLLLLVVAFAAQLGDLKLAESAALYALSFAAAGGVVYWFGRRFSWRSPVGQVGLREVLGLQEFLKRVEKERLRELPSETLERLLPYAMVLGIEGQWVAAFKDLVAPYPWYTQAAAALAASADTGFDAEGSQLFLYSLDAMVTVLKNDPSGTTQLRIRGRL